MGRDDLIAVVSSIGNGDCGNNHNSLILYALKRLEPCQMAVQLNCKSCSKWMRNSCDKFLLERGSIWNKNVFIKKSCRGGYTHLWRLMLNHFIGKYKGNIHLKVGYNLKVPSKMKLPWTFKMEDTMNLKFRMLPSIYSILLKSLSTEAHKFKHEFWELWNEIRSIV